jgi:hypothetical protein
MRRLGSLIGGALLATALAVACDDGQWGEGRCSDTDLSGCAEGEICQSLADNVCAEPCTAADADAHCEELAEGLVCHPAAGGRCAPPCDPAGEAFDCALFAEPITTCDASTFRCVAPEDLP